MFIRLTQEPEGLPIHVRTARIAAFAKTTEGTRLFLGGGLSCLVAEDEDAVLAAIRQASAPQPD